MYAVASDGVVIRTRVTEIRSTGRDTMGVQLMNVGDAVIVGVALGEVSDDEDDDAVDPAGSSTGADPTTEASDTPASALAEVAGDPGSATVNADTDASGSPDGPDRD